MADITADKADAKKSVGPLTFFRQVRAEGRKIHWTTRKETILGTIMVFVLASAAAVFFFLVDMILQWGVKTLLGFFS
ncbi:MAG: preprotein translocase subunit SecE [Caulobacterales bacterium]